MNNCTTHFYACACREHNFATLIKSTLDCASELDALKNHAQIDDEERQRIADLIERTYVACEVVQLETIKGE